MGRTALGRNLVREAPDTAPWPPLRLRLAVALVPLVLHSGCSRADADLIARVGDVSLHEAKHGVVLRRGENELPMEGTSPERIAIASAGPSRDDVLVFLDSPPQVTTEGTTTFTRTDFTLFVMPPGGLDMRAAYQGLHREMERPTQGSSWETTTWLGLEDIDDDDVYELLQRQSRTSSYAGKGPGRWHFFKYSAQGRFEPIADPIAEDKDRAKWRERLEMKSDVREACAAKMGSDCDDRQSRSLVVHSDYLFHVGDLQAVLLEVSGGGLALAAVRRDSFDRRETTLDVVPVGGDGHDDASLHVLPWSHDHAQVAVVVEYREGERSVARVFPWVGGDLVETIEPFEVGEGCPTTRFDGDGTPKVTFAACPDPPPLGR